MEVQRQRKRRKWDVPASQAGSHLEAPLVASLGPQSGQPLPPEAVKRAQEAAKAVVDRLNRESLAKGLVPAARMNLLAEVERKEIFRDVTINDAPSQIRYYLTRRGTQEMVQRASNTVIVTKGRFCGGGSPVDGLEKPLFLRITPGHGAGETDEARTRSVEKAVGIIQHILQGEKAPSTFGVPPADTAGLPSLVSSQSVPTNTPAPSPPTSNTSRGIFQTKVPVDIPAVPGFDLINRIKGPDQKFLHHITSQTGATAVLQTQGVDAHAQSEPLHLLLTCTSKKGLDDAVRLAQNLIATVQAESMKQHYAHTMMPPQAGYYDAQGMQSGIGAYAPPQSYATHSTTSHATPEHAYAHHPQYPYTVPYPQQAAPPYAGYAPYAAPAAHSHEASAATTPAMLPPPPPATVTAAHGSSSTGIGDREQHTQKRKFREMPQDSPQELKVEKRIPLGPEVPPPPSLTGGTVNVTATTTEAGSQEHVSGEAKDVGSAGLTRSGDAGIAAGLVDYEGDD